MIDPIFTLLWLAIVILPIWTVIFWLRRENRRFRRTKGFVLVGCTAAAVIGFICYSGSAIFVSNDGILNAYVIVPAPKTNVFNDDLGGVIARHGFSRNPGKSTFDDGLTYYVMNGVGHYLWFWSTNLPMSADEDPAICGKYPEAHPDPGQFALSLSRLWPFGTRLAQQEYMTKITTDLKAAGYEIRKQPLLCSPASKLLAPR